MKSAIFFCALSFAISAVEGLPSESNAQRLARGLPPLPPRRRHSGAKRTTPSSTPIQCETKKTFCCSDLSATSSSSAKNILSGLGIPSSSCGEHIGTGCIAAFGDSWFCAIQLNWYAGEVLRESVRARWYRLHACFSLHVVLAPRIDFVFAPRIFVRHGLVAHQLGLVGALEQHTQQLGASILFDASSSRASSSASVPHSSSSATLSSASSSSSRASSSATSSSAHTSSASSHTASSSSARSSSVSPSSSHASSSRASTSTTSSSVRSSSASSHAASPSSVLSSSSSRVSSSVSPSSTPVNCDTKKIFCCSDLKATSSSSAKSILSGLGIPSNSCGEHIGTDCVAAFGDSCLIGTPARCCGSLFGLIGIDCTPVSSSTSTSHAGSSSSSRPASSSVPASFHTSSTPRSSSSSSAHSSSAHSSSSASVSRSTSSTSRASSSEASSSRASSSTSHRILLPGELGLYLPFFGVVAHRVFKQRAQQFGLPFLFSRIQLARQQLCDYDHCSQQLSLLSRRVFQQRP
ncbi:hypothetical protein FB451DRAFT_1167049 [Mycena latifolia]|nr:hypothetical protein FB451DRAFT_1167049 [Mycena latifolia]